MYHLVLDHHMVDGNKRFAMLATHLFLRKNGYEWQLSKEEYVRRAITIADQTTRPTLEELRQWMARTVRPATTGAQLETE